MLDLADVAIGLVKKTMHCYFEEKDMDYILANCINEDIPIIGFDKTDWVNFLKIENEHYQFYRLNELDFMIYGKLSIVELSDSEEQNEVVKNITITCKLLGDEISFTCVHMSHERGRPFAISNNDSEISLLYREAMEKLFDVFVEYDNINDYFEYNEEEFEALFETDAHFINIDQMFWYICSECVHPDDMEKTDIFRNIDIEKRIKNNDCKIQFEARIKSKEKGYKWVEAVVLLFTNNVYKLNKVFCLFRDIDNKKKSELENKLYARKDSLTGALNRRYAEAMIKVAVRENEKYSALAIIDIDDFKKINDTFGHMSGDEVIKRIVDVIYQVTDDTDILGRLGGDEFLLFIRNREKVEDIYSIMEEIISHTRFTYTEYNKEMDIHVSIGVATFNSTEVGFDELYKVSDEALYEVKKANKNTYKLKEI
ncbi:MAG: sensor domain-containing diguanylate cyclase [Lachnospiraceae bacterium]|nr:sensor domain-containing diguanylate cyclase [Lachnospiraceae bacterium]